MNKFSSIVIVILAAIIFLQRTCSGVKIPETPSVNSVVIDTVYIQKDTTITKTVTRLKQIYLNLPGDSIFVADTNYNTLKSQYESLSKTYSARNIYQDTILIDSLGKVVIRDTLQYNHLQRRSYKLSYKIPVITKTETIASRRQMYLGGGLSMTTGFTDLTAQVSVLYKTKKDHIFGVYTLLNGTSKPQVGVNTFWKITK